MTKEEAKKMIAGISRKDKEQLLLLVRRLENTKNERCKS